MTVSDGSLLMSYPLKRGVIIRESCLTSSDKSKTFDSVLGIYVPKKRQMGMKQYMYRSWNPDLYLCTPSGSLNVKPCMRGERKRERISGRERERERERQMKIMPCQSVFLKGNHGRL